MVGHNEYFNRYLKMIMAEKNRNKSGEQIYQDLEAWHVAKTGKTKCKTYESFRSLKSQWYKANKPR